MCILGDFGLLSHSFKPLPELFERSFLNPRNVRPRDEETIFLSQNLQDFRT